VSLEDEGEIEIILRPGLLIVNCIWGAFGVEFDQPMCR